MKTIGAIPKDLDNDVKEVVDLKSVPTPSKEKEPITKSVRKTTQVKKKK